MSNLNEIELNEMFEKKSFAPNENIGNSSTPNDIFSENNEKTEKYMKIFDDKVESDDLSDDEILLSQILVNKQDGNDKEPQEKVEKDNDDLSSRCIFMSLKINIHKNHMETSVDMFILILISKLIMGCPGIRAT